MMFEKFIDNLIEGLERGNKFEITKMNQSELRYFLDENIDEYGQNFPMICYEHTDDSPDEVSFEESKFLNDKEHEGVWIVGEQFGEVVFIACLQEDDNEIEIDAFEVNTTERGNRIASYVIDEIEYNASTYYDGVYISPFDTNAMNFWKHNGYNEEYAGYYVKHFEDDDF